MARDRNKRLILLIVLVAVVSVSIGFAALSSSLLVKSTANVDPNRNLFSVVFSTDASTEVTNSIIPTKVPTNLDADAATINNDYYYPTINDINVIFTKPGQSVTYKFYALNKGKYDAYLTSIVLENLNSGSFKKCIPGEGASVESVNNACDSIEVTVTAGDLTVTGTTLGIQAHKLLQGKSEVVTITIEYKETGTLADGPVEVNFGNIYLTYGTQQTSEMPNLPSTTGCYLLRDVNSDRVADIGDMVTCGGDNFYVIPQSTSSHASANENTVTLLAEKNITLSTTNPVQSNSAGTIEFVDDSYDWGSSSTGWTVSTYDFIYGSDTLLYSYVEAYGNKLKSSGVNVLESSIISYWQIKSLACTEEEISQIMSNWGYFSIYGCNSAPDWLVSTDYWTGTVIGAYGGSYALWEIKDGEPYHYDGNYGEYATMNNLEIPDVVVSGIRPVIIINRSEIG